MEIITKVATIGGLCIAYLAYENTIKPLFEKQKLENQISVLIDEKKLLNYNIKENKNRIILLKDKENNLTLLLNTNKKLVKNKELKISNLSTNILLFKNNVKNLTNEVRRKKENIDILSSKIGVLSIKSVKLEWQIFLNTFSTKFFNEKQIKIDLIYNTIDTMNLNSSLIILTTKEKLLLEDNFPLTLILNSLKKFKYSKDFGFSETRFNTFKLYIMNAVNLNKNVFFFKESKIGLKEKVNVKIMNLINNNINNDFNVIKNISDMKRKYLMDLNLRKIGAIMLINNFLYQNLSSIEIKSVK